MSGLASIFPATFSLHFLCSSLTDAVCFPRDKHETNSQSHFLINNKSKYTFSQPGHTVRSVSFLNLMTSIFALPEDLSSCQVSAKFWNSTFVTRNFTFLRFSSSEGALSLAVPKPYHKCLASVLSMVNTIVSGITSR